jgi:hypothetical protein
MMSISPRHVALASMMVLAAPAVAQQSGTGWYGIGQAVAPADAGSVTIAAHGDAGNHELMVCIEGHVMRLNQATLHFQGGGMQTMRISERVTDGGCSGGHGLSGHNHAVESAEVTYDQAALAGGTAHVQLFVR